MPHFLTRQSSYTLTVRHAVKALCVYIYLYIHIYIKQLRKRENPQNPKSPVISGYKQTVGL